MNNSPKNVFTNRNFRNLWLGGVISSIGDQLTLIALPWLVLKLTGDVVAVGSVLAIISVPRAVFMLIGGALTDRFKPRNLLIYARSCSCILLLLLSLMVWSNTINLSVLYVIALLLGLSSAFAIPAVMSILPSILKPEQLQTGNGITMIAMQLSTVVGPILAGYVIVKFSLSAETAQLFSSDAIGIAIVFLADAVTFAISVFSLLFVTIADEPKESVKREESKINGSIIHSIIDGFNYMKSDSSLFMYMIYIAVISFFIVGPAIVGIPILVETKFIGDAMDYGSFMTIQGAGMTAGMILVTMLPPLPGRRLGTSILSLDFMAGVCVSILAHTNSIQVADALLFIIGIIGGFIQVTAFTWIQKRITSEFLGRMMSFIMFASLGLAPISSALAGYFISITSVTTMFTVMGAMIMSLALVGLTSSSIRKMGLNPSQTT